MTRQDHLLIICMEECAEVAQRLSKALRFGMDEVQATAAHGVTTGAPEESLNNRQRVAAEFTDLVAVMEMAGFALQVVNGRAVDAKIAKVERFLRFSADNGRLDATPPAEAAPL